MFGLENIGKGSVEEAHATVNDLITRLDPLLHMLEMRAAGIIDTLVTRVGKTKITITIEIPPAGADWEKTPPS
jgi:hypothetical protein